MTPVSIYSGAPENVFYLPHHAVFKADSSTTKTRVVFDASCKTTSGVSLNQILHDVILGTNVYANIVKTNIKKDRGGLIAQETELGWIVLGRTKSSFPKNEVVSMISLAEIDKDLRAFWEMDVADNAVRELEEECETHFKNTHSRDSDGRYTVRLPFKQNTDLKLGDSRKQALARFLSMEKKFAKDSKLKEDYTDFMREYSELNSAGSTETWISKG
uniref:Peptidase aspartic putative domain-containing protein n=1 Tax=Phlebotomus papatasi TaxID=29031 RepID=A0A1B0DP93_PHLPP